MVSNQFSITLPAVHLFLAFLGKTWSLDMYVVIKCLLENYLIFMTFHYSELMLSINLQVVEWLEYAPTFLSGSEFENACSFVDGFLASRTFLVGYGLTIADTAIWSNLAGNLWVLITIHLSDWFQAL